MPIVWGQETYTAAGLGEAWEEQASHGYRHGIAMAMHLPAGRHFLVGVERDQSLPHDFAEVLRIVADLQLFATCAQEASFRILSPEPEQAELPALTPRELDTLRWTMDGKSAREVGDVLGFSERTTVMHLNHAMRKLGCNSKHQAVLKALRLGMLR